MNTKNSRSKTSKKTLQIAEQIYDELRLVTRGMSFKDRVELEKKNNAIFAKLIETNPDVKKQIKSVDKFISDIETRHNKLAKKWQLQSKKNDEIEKRNLDPFGRQFPFHRTHLVCDCPPSPSSFFMIPMPRLPVHLGLFGYSSDRPHRENTSGEKIQTETYRWQATIPEDGSYSFWSRTGPVYIKTRYELEGSGVWGLDARIEVEYSDIIFLDDGTTLKSRVRLIKEDSKVSGGRSNGRADSYDIPSGWSFTFKAKKDQVISRVMQKRIYTFAGNGSVSHTSEQFAVISNYSGDRVCQISP